jgi:hypothetical protein
MCTHRSRIAIGERNRYPSYRELHHTEPFGDRMNYGGKSEGEILRKRFH